MVTYKYRETKLATKFGKLPDLCLTLHILSEKCCHFEAFVRKKGETSET